MSLVYADRVQETFTTTGTGTISLGGAVTGYQAFSAKLADGDTCYYGMTDGTNWEIGLGTFTLAGDTLARTTVLDGSAGVGTHVNWSAGTKSVWLDYPAAAVSGGLTVGTSAISSGTSGRILYDNGGILGELTTTGSGDVVRATSPTLVTPALGTPTSGDLSNCTNAPAALMTALGVGSIILGTINNGVTVTAGQTKTASLISPSFVPIGSYNGDLSTIIAVPSNDTIAGTWRALGSTTTGQGIILWQRIV